MCMVSYVSEYGGSIPMSRWTQQGLDQFKVALAEAEEFDKLNEEPHCDDPDKLAWMKEVEERLQRIESQLFRKS